MGKTLAESFTFFLPLTSFYWFEKEDEVATYSVNKHKVKTM